MSDKDEILNNRFFKWDYKTLSPGRYQIWIHDAMDEYAKQEAIEFFKWNAIKAAEYIDYLRRVDKAEGISEKELELDSFENSSIAKRYELYRKEKENNLLASEIH